MNEVQLIVEELALYGVITSFCYGLCEGKGILWSVHCARFAKWGLNGEFDEPLAAESLLHAAEIARVECRKRGWIK